MTRDIRDASAFLMAFALFLVISRGLRSAQALRAESADDVLVQEENDAQFNVTHSFSAGASVPVMLNESSGATQEDDETGRRGRKAEEVTEEGNPSGANEFGMPRGSDHLNGPRTLKVSSAPPKPEPNMATVVQSVSRGMSIAALLQAETPSYRRSLLLFALCIVAALLSLMYFFTRRRTAREVQTHRAHSPSESEEDACFKGRLLQWLSNVSDNPHDRSKWKARDVLVSRDGAMYFNNNVGGIYYQQLLYDGTALGQLRVSILPSDATCHPYVVSVGKQLSASEGGPTLFAAEDRATLFEFLLHCDVDAFDSEVCFKARFLECSSIASNNPRDKSKWKARDVMISKAGVMYFNNVGGTYRHEVLFDGAAVGQLRVSRLPSHATCHPYVVSVGPQFGASGGDAAPTLFAIEDRATLFEFLLHCDVDEFDSEAKERTHLKTVEEIEEPEPNAQPDKTCSAQPSVALGAVQSRFYVCAAATTIGTFDSSQASTWESDASHY